MTTVDTGVAGGVSFALTDEQKELRALARSFAENEIRPRAAECDEHQTHATDIIAKAHEIGLMNLHLPEWLGGPELPCFDGMLVGEELNWGCSGIGTSIGANGLGAGPILIAGTEEQKKQWLGPLVEAPILGCFGLTEPGAGSDVSGHSDHGGRQGRRVRDQRVEDVHHERRSRVVDGVLRLDRPRARAPRASRPSSCRWTRPASRSRSTSTRWGSARPTRPPLRSRTSSSRQRTGSVPRARASRSRCRRSISRGPGTAVGAVGVAQAAFELAVDYTKERAQFGMPIAMNQGVSFLVADMATEIEAARLLCWQAAWMIDEG